MTAVISNVKNSILTSPSKYIEMLAIPVVSGIQTYEDYKKAGKEDKKNVLMKDIVTLGATCAGAYGLSLISQKKLKLSSNITTLAAIPIGGMLGGLIAGGIAEKLFPTSNASFQMTTNEIIKEERNSKNPKNSFAKNITVMVLTCIGLFVGNYSAKKLLNKLNLTEFQKLASIGGSLLGGISFNFLTKKQLGIKNDAQPIQQVQNYLGDVSTSSGLFNSPLNGVFNNTFSTMSGYSLSKEKDTKTKIQKSCFQVVSGIIVPASIIIPTINFIENKTEKFEIPSRLIEKINKYNPIKPLRQTISGNVELQKEIIKRSLLIPVSIGGIYLGNYIGNLFNKKITENVVKQEVWNNISQAHKDLMKMSLNLINSSDTELKKQVLNDLQKVKCIEPMFNPNNK